MIPVLKRWLVCLVAGWLICSGPLKALAEAGVFARTNLAAWCIVPFDARKRTPEQRGEMLERLGIRMFAYDWRDEHILTFDEEIAAMDRHGVNIIAWWFPANLDATAKKILEVLERHKIKAQLWVMLVDPAPGKTNAMDKVRAAAAILRPIADEAERIGCKVGLYNHGGWFGEPENQLAVIREIGKPNVGMVYNFHHGHDHIDRFKTFFPKIKPYLLALNLNGMIRDGERLGKKIFTLGQGTEELAMMRVVVASGWKGPVGIIDHRPETDSEITLRENLEGFDWLAKELKRPGSGGAKPSPRAEAKPEPRDAAKFWAVEDPAGRMELPEFIEIPGASAKERTVVSKRPKAQEFLRWERSLGGAGSARFSGLSQINTGNVANLEQAWVYHSKDGSANIQCNPIVVNGVLYLPTAGGAIAAVRGDTGEEIWRYRPELGSGKAGLADPPARRGLIYWPGGKGSRPRIIFGAGRWLYALDASSGRPVGGFGNKGRVWIEAASSVAPAIYQDVIVLPGYELDIYGIRVTDGARLWTFHTMPYPGEPGAETWRGREEGANCWGGMALDEKRGIAYIATGSPKPNFMGMLHRGSNLYANCVIALDAKSGRRLWHFQEIAHDIWDWDIPAPPVLATIQHEGKLIDVVAQVTKQANTLVLDRVTGKTIYPFRLRKAPTSKLPGERTEPYQPDLVLPEPFARNRFTTEDVTRRTEEAREAIQKTVSIANLGFFPPLQEARPTVLFNIHGGAEWTGACVDVRNGMLYVSANEIPWHITVVRDDEPPKPRGVPPSAGEFVYQKNCASCHGLDRRGLAVAPPLIGLRNRLKDDDVLKLLANGRNGMPAAPALTDVEKAALLDFVFLRDRPDAPVSTNTGPRFTFTGFNKLLDPEGYPGCTPPWGTLNCIDLNTGKIAWKVPLGEYPELTKQGVAKTGTENFGGASVTAGGLVFCSGTHDDMIRAFDSATGRELWSRKLPLHGTAPPAIYEAGGRQYVIVAATGGGKLGGPTGDAWVAFALKK